MKESLVSFYFTTERIGIKVPKAFSAKDLNRNVFECSMGRVALFWPPR